MSKNHVFLTKNGEKQKITVHSEEGYYYICEEVVMNLQKWNWVRLEVRKKDGTFLGYVNPVYCGYYEPECTTVEEIWAKMEDN